MDTYVWYSKGTKESGDLLAHQIGGVGNHGTNPPKGFKGAGICFGARPREVFKWENRNFKALFNDPRKVANISSDKRSLIESIKLAGGNVIPTVSLQLGFNYEEVLRSLGGTSFYCCSKNLIGAVQVSSQNELQRAFQEGKTIAVNENFKNKETYRVYVVNGKPVVTLSKSFEPDNIIKKMATDDRNGEFSEATYQKLKGWLEQGRIILDENESVLKENIGALRNFRIQHVVNTVNNRVQMYCIEYVKVGVNYVVNNIIFTPSLEALSEGAMSLIGTQIKEWIKTNSKTFKESLLRLINESSEAEAEAMLGAINQYANN